MLKGEWWKQDNGPLLAFRGEAKRAVAVLPASARTAELFDPLDQRTSPINREIATGMQPFAYAFYRPFPAEKLSLLDLLRFGLKGCKSECATILLTGAAIGLLAVVFPYVTGVAFDRLIPGAENGQLAAICGLLLSMAVGTALLGYSRGCAVLRLEGKMSATVQAAVWDRLLSLPVSFFRNYSSGDLAQRSMGIEQIRQMMTSYSLRAVLSGIFSAFSLMLLFYYSVPLALVAAGLLAISYIATFIWTVAQVSEQRELCNLQGQISGKLLQFISGIAKFRVSGTENRAFAVWARLFSRQKQVAMRARQTSNQLTVFNSVFSVVSLGALFYFHGLVMSSSSPGRMKTGEFLAFLVAFTQCMVAALTLNSTVVSSAKIVPLYERSKPILEAIPEVTESKADPGMLMGDVEISQVTFRYAQGLSPALRDVSIKIPRGQFVAVVGPSGSGKSTLLRLLLGFETPENGAIYYDGQDLNGLDVQSVRRQIGVVLQSSRPIGGTLFENIIGSAPLTVKDAWEAARMAGIEDDIRRMPMGLHTFLAAGGQGISGGQRQRLLIARAIVGRPRILLFDEATSALDNRTQETVSRSLESLQSTRIVIAHRLSTILHADRIFVLDKGTIVQSGCYQELMEQEGLFREFAKRQLA
jgi:NHLM bacteriocin system ABC transporter ATP-binding protein